MIYGNKGKQNGERAYTRINKSRYKSLRYVIGMRCGKMSDKTFSIQECRKNAYQYLNSCKVNIFLIQDFWESDKEEDYKEMYQIARDLLFDTLLNNSNEYSSNMQDDSWFRSIEDELYKLFTKKGEYTNHVGYFELILGGAVSRLSENLYNTYSIDYSVSFGLASVLIYTIGKIGVNVWCVQYRKKRGLASEK